MKNDVILMFFKKFTVIKMQEIIKYGVLSFFIFLRNYTFKSVNEIINSDAKNDDSVKG